jgi:hypothetical protein
MVVCLNWPLVMSNSFVGNVDVNVHSHLSYHQHLRGASRESNDFTTEAMSIFIY